MCLRASMIAIIALGCAPHQNPHPPSPAFSPQPVVMHSREQIARGAYVAAIAGCTTCHTPMMPDGQLPDHSRELAGGSEVRLPDGSLIRMPNITVDRETGIGKWSDAQIVAAIRQGVRPDGARLAPMMPYAYYNRMTDSDAAAVVAYVRAEPPVRQRVARSEGVRTAGPVMAAPRGYVDRAADPKAHGEYIASLMHCGACHTPQRGPFANQTFAGGLAMGPSVVSANISSDPETGIGAWGEADVIDAVRAMRTPSGATIRAPMAMYREAWSQLSDDDAHALAVYVKSVPAVKHEVKQPAEEPPNVSARR
jgi:mono/diheme cytochrome c family protein